MNYSHPALPVEYSAASADQKARARRAEFITRNDLRAIDSTDENVVRLIRILQQDWIDGRVRPRFCDPKAAIKALAKLATRYGPSGDAGKLGRDFQAGMNIYSRRETGRPCLLATHCDAVGPSDIRELDDWRSAGFDLILIGEPWIVRPGVRVLISNPVDITLTPYPEPDPDLMPGPSYGRPRHVRLRAARTGDAVHTPEREPIRGNS